MEELNPKKEDSENHWSDISLSKLCLGCIWRGLFWSCLAGGFVGVGALTFGKQDGATAWSIIVGFIYGMAFGFSFSVVHSSVFSVFITLGWERFIGRRFFSSPWITSSVCGLIIVTAYAALTVQGFLLNLILLAPPSLVISNRALIGTVRKQRKTVKPISIWLFALISIFSGLVTFNTSFIYG